MTTVIAALPLAMLGAWEWSGATRGDAAPCAVWTIVTSPKLEGGILHAVDADASNDVWAVGENGSLYGIIDHWDGTAWTLTTQQGVNNVLYAVAAVSPSDVWVGGYKTDLYPQAFTEHWDGTAWTTVRTPTPGSQSSVLAMVALSSTDLWAAGYYFQAGFLRELYLHWDGTMWMQVPGPRDPGPTVFGLSAVSTDDIWAFGSRSSGQQFATAPLSQHWDGTTWTSIRPARIPGAGSRQFFAGAAVSSSDVWAVGYGEYSGSAIEHWDGLQWRYVRAPDSGLFLGADSTGSNDVWAVGRYQSGTNAPHPSTGTERRGHLFRPRIPAIIRSSPPSPLSHSLTSGPWVGTPRSSSAGTRPPSSCIRREPAEPEGPGKLPPPPTSPTARRRCESLGGANRVQTICQE